MGDPFKELIKSPIVIKKTHDAFLEVHDEASTSTTEMKLDVNGISGIHSLSDNTISFDPARGIKDILFRAGEDTVINVTSTPIGQSVTIDTLNQGGVSPTKRPDVALYHHLSFSYLFLLCSLIS